MEKLLRFLSRAGVTRGFLGKSRAWTVVGALALTIRALKRLFAGSGQTAYTYKLRPGEALVISHGREPRVVRAPGLDS